ncbi:MAG TPA: two-component regulator propeller domain-containing protein [Thermoanaerobaculia bacterium]|nr:two-component regulator propeller domain-containing protein [Thermoanaerobaculia bacterium]
MAVHGGLGSVSRNRAAAIPLLAMLWIFPAAANGLHPGTPLSQYGHDVWDSDSGLPQNSVDAIAQTQDGYLWLGTQEGLVRFDGVRFTVFDTRNTPALRDDWVHALRQTRDGTLWVGTAEGLVSVREGRFPRESRKDELSTSNVLALFESRDGSLWVGTTRGIARRTGDRVRLFGEKEGAPAGAVLAIVEDRDGVLWIGSRSGLSRFQGEGFVSVEAACERGGAVLSLLPDPEGGLWVGTTKGLSHWDGHSLASETLPGAAAGAPVQALYRDGEGTLWIGTARGLARRSNGTISLLSNEQRLSSDEIDAIAEDREGSLWVGTRDGGLNRLKDERVANFTDRQGLPDNKVWSVFEDRSANLWVGTADGSVSRARPGSSSFEVQARVGAPVLSLAEDETGGLWIGTRGNGAYRLEGTKLRHWTVEDGFRPISIPALCADRRGGVWLGTAGSGLFLYQNGRFTQWTDKDGLGSNAVFTVYQDRSDALWIGTFGGGLSRFSAGGFETWTTREGLAHNIVLSILEEPPGTFWFGTRGGLSRWSDGKFTTYRQREGLFHDAVQRVLDDGHGYLWLTSNRGIFRVRSSELAAFAQGRRSQLHPVGFTTANGMRSVECNNGQQGGWKGRDGRLWFATLKGLAMADPQRIELNRVPPKVVVERIVAGRRALAASNDIVVPSPVRDVEFDYTALSFRNPGAIRFRYRLDGYDRGWIEAGGRREAYYTNLPPGHFVFRVIACNEDGVWSPSGASSELTFARSLTETAGFQAAIFVLAALVTWGTHRLRVKRLAAREALRTAVVEARLSSLQAQLQPHFLFNALNSLLPLVGSEPGRAKRMIIRIADLLRASLLSETTSVVTLERDLAVLDEYLDIERMRFRDRIRVEIEADANARTAAVPSFLLQPLVENALKHGADPRTGRVRVQLSARVEEEELILVIRDDGPGLAPEPGALSRGIGLSNLRRRLETLYPGRHRLSLTNTPEGGCEVLVRIPFSSEPIAGEVSPWRRRVRAARG